MFQVNPPIGWPLPVGDHQFRPNPLGQSAVPQIQGYYQPPNVLLDKVRAIREMLEAKVISRAEARKMLGSLDYSFAAILRAKS